MTQAAVASTTVRDIFVTGASGCMGTHLIQRLLDRGHRVWGLLRNGSEARLQLRCTPVIGDALRGTSYATRIPAAATFVHLVGVPHPSPAKAAEFRRVDLVSVQQAVPAAVAAGVQHFVYVSVAHPAPIMKAYQAVRCECEEILRQSGLTATILRPWYVLGPGHHWPRALIPFYKFFEFLPRTREAARRLGLVTVQQMVAALAAAVEEPSNGVHCVEVPEIRRATRR